MLSVKGLFENGVAKPAEPVAGRDGQKVIITFLEDEASNLLPADADTAWQELTELLENSAGETGIADLADQHDHYLYGQAKRKRDDA